MSIKYSKHIITYVDILGFKKILAEKDPAYIKSIINELTKIFEPRKYKSPFTGMTERDKGVIVTNFSDLIVRTRKVASAVNLIKLFNDELQRLAYAQLLLIGKGILIRGVVTIDDLYHNKQAIYGPGLVRAYQMEQKLAIYPRIIIDPKAFDLLGNFKNKSNLAKYVINDIKRLYRCGQVIESDNGLYFINYLERPYISGLYTGLEVYDILLNHKRDISSISTHKDDLYYVSTKVNWLINYHNNIVKSLPKEYFENIRKRRFKLLISENHIPSVNNINHIFNTPLEPSR